MKRSEINRFEREALEFFKYHHFNLPAWATWRPEDWKRADSAAAEIKRRRLGWDITDFGKGKFKKEGLVLFTLRNGPADGSGEPYCEKLMISRLGQTMPAHFHWSKTEDIINRAGGKMIMKLWNSDKLGGATDERVKARIDGLWREVAAGEELELAPGESITLTPGLYHSLFARGKDILIGEVSTVNDDEKDNRFLKPISRFSNIEEDEDILYYLCNEYP